MKRLIIILFALLLTIPAFAGEEMYYGKKATCAGPSFYNATPSLAGGGNGQVVLAWEANDDSGTSYAYDNSCTPVSGTISNGDVGTYQGKTAFRVDAGSETIHWSQSSDQYADIGSDQTICFLYYMVAAPTNTQVYIGHIMGASANYYREIVTNAPNAMGYWGPDTQTIYGTGTLTTAAWKTRAYSYQGGTIPDGDHSVNNGNGSPWANDWNDNADELDTSPGGITDIYIGTYTSTTPGGAGHEIYIAAWALVDGYKAACNELWTP